MPYKHVLFISVCKYMHAALSWQDFLNLSTQAQLGIMDEWESKE